MRKNVLYFFHKIAKKNTKLLQWMSDGKFSVFTLSYVKAVNFLTCNFNTLNVSIRSEVFSFVLK